MTVSDRGPGLNSPDPETIGLGLAGLRERIESLGGEFHLDSTASGTRLTMLLKIEQS